MSPKSSITLFILKNTVGFDRTFHPTYLVTLGNVEATYLKGHLPQKVHFIITNMDARKENFHIQETALTTYWRRKDTRQAMCKGFYGSDATFPPQVLRRRHLGPNKNVFTKESPTPSRTCERNHILVVSH